MAEFRYDGNNDRLEQTQFTNGTASGTTEYTNDTIGLTQVLVSDGGAGNVIYQLYGNTLLGQQLAGSSQFQTYITDGLGSVRIEMETSGATNYVRTFSPFGETLDEKGNRSSVYGYTGQQEDESTGLIYLRARYYSAELKAFTAYDVWPGESRRPQSLNHYAYVTGNPVNYFDPTGRCNGVFKFIRRAERQACENFDAAKGIANHQDATFWEKTMARSYRTTFVASHVGLAVGGGYLAANASAVPAAAKSIGYSALKITHKVNIAADAYEFTRAVLGDPQARLDRIMMAIMDPTGISGSMSFLDDAMSFCRSPISEMGAIRLGRQSGEFIDFFHGTGSPEELFKDGIILSKGGGQVHNAFFTTLNREFAERWAREFRRSSTPGLIHVRMPKNEYEKLNELNIAGLDERRDRLFLGIAASDPDMSIQPYRNMIDNADVIIQEVGGYNYVLEHAFRPSAQSAFDNSQIKFIKLYED